MNWTQSPDRSVRDESGLSLIELMVAVALLLVVITIAFIVTTTVVTVTSTTQRSGLLTGPAQTGMETLQAYFSGAVPNQTINTPTGVPPNTAPLYSNQCSATVHTSTATDVWLCSVRTGSNTAYTYEIHFPTCTANGVCTLQVTQNGVAQPVVQISNVCVTCTNATNTSFGFASPPADLSTVSNVTITLTVAAAPPNGTAKPAATATLVRQVLLPNSLGGFL
jgi:prepilin-type N-terminal cleavage/methylation domain-containing protein